MTLSVLGCVAAPSAVVGGPISPPPGPVTSTHKTLGEMEPRIAVNAANTPGDDDSIFRITAPGSYYLTGNITGEWRKYGIEIASSGVTLDLSGFELVGTSGVGDLDGISVTVTGLTDIAVRNGVVRNWGDNGIDLGVATNSVVASVRASTNYATGITVGSNSVIVECTSHDNLGNGFVVNDGCVVALCTSSANSNVGIRTGSSCMVDRCTARENGDDGIVAESATVITGCTAATNTGAGISVGSNCSIGDSVAFMNMASGIVMGQSGIVSGCVSGLNVLNGIYVLSQSSISDNVCAFNGNDGGFGAGVSVGGSDNRIQGNTCVGADLGIDVNAEGNIIIRNTCSGNTTNWDVVAGNVILVVNASVAGPVVGNSGGVSPGSTDPNANFTY